jgi:hypothetical protein
MIASMRRTDCLKCAEQRKRIMSMIPNQTIFESATCGRCGGSGNYSYNQVNGTTCFGCGGAGVKLTKRGSAAKAFYVESQQVPVADLKPGMFVWDDTWGKKPKFMPVLSIKLSDCQAVSNGVTRNYVYIETSRCNHGVFAESKVRAVRDEAQRQEQLAAALAYQATLTKMGKPASHKTAVV